MFVLAEPFHLSRKMSSELNSTFEKTSSSFTHPKSSKRGWCSHQSLKGCLWSLGGQFCQCHTRLGSTPPTQQEASHYQDYDMFMHFLDRESRAKRLFATGILGERHIFTFRARAHLSPWRDGTFVIYPNMAGKTVLNHWIESTKKNKF